MALKGKTSADLAGIDVQGGNKWITIIQNASKQRLIGSAEVGLQMPFIERIRARIAQLESLRVIIANMYKLYGAVIEDSIKRQLSENDKYRDPKRLIGYEYQAYSQNGEDGIIEEIFKRIGTTDRFFVET